MTHQEIKDKMSECARANHTNFNNLDVFNYLLAQAELQKLTLGLTDYHDLCYEATMHGADIIVHACFSNHIFSEHFLSPNGEIRRNTILIKAMQSNNQNIINQLLEMRIIHDELIENPASVLIPAANYANPETMLRVMRASNFDYNFKDCFQILNTAYVHFNKPLCNYLLSINPQLLDYIDSIYRPAGSSHSMTKWFIDFYLPQLQQRKLAFEKGTGLQFDLTTIDAELSYLILRNLISNYSNKVSIQSRHPSTNSILTMLRNKFGYTEVNLKLNSIKFLLSIPAVSQLVARDDNLLLRIAIRDNHNDIIQALRVILGNEPLDVYMAGQPIDLKALYQAKYPSQQENLVIKSSHKLANTF